MLLRALILLLALASGVFGSTALAADPMSDGPDAREQKKDKKTEEEKTEEQKRAEEEEERKRRELLARVLVLKWRGTSVDYTDETVRRNVRSRIARPEAMFFPEVDLYQNGRKVRDQTVIPANQPAVVPDSNIPPIMAEVARVQAIPWDAMQLGQWYQTAVDLARLAEGIWFVDRVELREPLFMLYATIGHAANNSGNPGPPFYDNIGNIPVNYYWYLAALLAIQEPALMSKLTNAEIRGSVQYILDQLTQGAFPSLKLDFEQENEYNAEQFNKDYEILINGLPAVLDTNARMDVFLGRTDIYLKRKDTGHGLSERLEVTKLEDSAYFVRDVARKMMGIEFIEQLFLNPNACLPELDGDILNYLAIYQKLHPKADVFIAVPREGNPNKVWIWQYDKQRAQLKYIGGGTDSFPIRFAFLFSTGLLYNGASTSVDDNVEDEDSLAPNDVLDSDRVSVAKEAATIPFDFELRMHYNRLMVNFGAEFGYNVGDDAKWQEYYQTPGKQKEDDIHTVRLENCIIPEDEDGDGEPDGDITCGDLREVFNRRSFNRHLYLGLGIVLGRDAGIGFGPRFAAQWGWTNMPHGWQTTAHFGWAIQPPIGDFGGRVRPMVDLDLRGGMAIARPRSLQYDLIERTAGQDEKRETMIEPVFGANLGIGLTF